MRALRSGKTLGNRTALHFVAIAAVLMAGCKGLSTQGERKATADLGSVGEAYRPQNQRPALPTLQTNASLSNLLQFAILNEPNVEAAYFDWAASVHRITVERSLPDPRLTFQSDIADMVMTLMPGLMMDFPGPGKLKWAASVATAESEGKYFVFENAILQTAFALKKAYYELYFLGAKVNVNRETLRLVGEIEKLARTHHRRRCHELEFRLRHRQRAAATANAVVASDPRKPSAAPIDEITRLRAGA